LHEEADALLPQGEEWEAHEKVDGFGEAFIGKEVIFGALREEYLELLIVCLLDQSVYIQAERLILRIRVDKAFGIVG
jgi:hypothetical protein